MNNLQFRDGLPDALVDEKRFFALRGRDKEAVPDDWNNPDNWKYLEDIPEDQYFGFAIGNNTDYLFIDCDHVRDPETGALVPWVNDALKRILAHSSTYSEVSMSGTGGHLICDLGDFADYFERESNSYNQIIIQMDPEEYRRLPKEEKEKVPKIELFYHAEGRYVYLTGRHKKLVQVAKNEDSASIFSELLEIRKEFHARYGKKTYSEDSSGRILIDDITRARVLEALPYISANDRETWVTVGIALSNCGFDFELWDLWSRFTDQRTGELCDKYNQEETPKIWKSFKNTKSHWNAGTIIKLAKANGYIIRQDGLEPKDYTDLGQAEIFIQEYGNIVRYSQATNFLVFDGKRWEEDPLKAQRLSQELTGRQLEEVKGLLSKARKSQDELIEGEQDPEEIKRAGMAVKRCEKYRKYILTRRASAKIKATLSEVAPGVQIDVKALDVDGYLLNTPGGTIDLRSGAIRAHRAEDHCTKITAVAPSTKGEDTWREFLDRLTVGDAELSRYLQEIAGTCAIGHVKREELIIATGSGGNGKSTFFNLLFKVLGDYSGMLSAETLTTNSRKNKSPEYAELRGKRMIVSAELEEGNRLDTSIVKKLCSTDPIMAEKKFKDPFVFIPSHHVILYTNFLPKIGTNDTGTWDRLVVVPFKARFRGQAGEIKDYASYLFQECGGAVLSWIIEGARRVISQGFMVQMPDCVKDAIEEYKLQSDWMQEFISECCVCDKRSMERGGDLYAEYRAYCLKSGEYTRSSVDFSRALEGAGYIGIKRKTGKVYRGLRLKTTADRLAELREG